jgi:hypothetical protein
MKHLHRGLVRQPGWLSHKSCNFSPAVAKLRFLMEFVRKLKFPNKSIQYFKRIGIAVKPDEQVFGRVSFLKHRVIFGNFERPPYVGFAHTVFESRPPENDSNVHCFDYTMPPPKPQYRAQIRRWLAGYMRKIGRMDRGVRE